MGVAGERRYEYPTPGRPGGAPPGYRAGRSLSFLPAPGECRLSPKNPAPPAVLFFRYRAECILESMATLQGMSGVDIRALVAEAAVRLPLWVGKI